MSYGKTESWSNIKSDGLSKYSPIQSADSPTGSNAHITTVDATIINTISTAIDTTVWSSLVTTFVAAIINTIGATIKSSFCSTDS